jgi:cobalt/nickel transport system permease protein
LILAMHAPDGFLEPPVAVATAIISAAVLARALRVSRRDLGDRQVPLAGLVAAFVFAAQMVNFPVASGTTGHLVGGTLCAVLLGPWVAALVMGIVVGVQALVFADGGLTALGYNTLNMAIVTTFGGWSLYLLFRRLMPPTRAGVAAATSLASGGSVVLAAAMFSLQWLFGASAPVPFDTVFGAMVGVHVLIGIGEAAISGMVISSVLASRPDLVAGAADLPSAAAGAPAPIPRRAALIGFLLVSLLVAAVVSQFSAGGPDGLERVALDEGIAGSEGGAVFDGSIFADYATAGIGDERLSLAIAGTAGVVLTIAIGFGMLAGPRRPRMQARAR